MHTPGPWTRKAGERFRHDESAGVKGPDGTYIAAALDLNRIDRDEEVEANARLMAAAPELLAACEDVSAFLDNMLRGQTQNSAMWRRLLAAIAKAKGEGEGR